MSERGQSREGNAFNPIDLEQVIEEFEIDPSRAGKLYDQLREERAQWLQLRDIKLRELGSRRKSNAAGDEESSELKAAVFELELQLSGIEARVSAIDGTISRLRQGKTTKTKTQSPRVQSQVPVGDDLQRQRELDDIRRDHERTISDLRQERKVDELKLEKEIESIRSSRRNAGAEDFMSGALHTLGALLTCGGCLGVLWGASSVIAFFLIKAWRADHRPA